MTVTSSGTALQHSTSREHAAEMFRSIIDFRYTPECFANTCMLLIRQGPVPADSYWLPVVNLMHVTDDCYSFMRVYGTLATEQQKSSAVNCAANCSFASVVKLIRPRAYLWLFTGCRCALRQANIHPRCSLNLLA